MVQCIHFLVLSQILPITQVEATLCQLDPHYNVGCFQIQFIKTFRIAIHVIKTGF